MRAPEEMLALLDWKRRIFALYQEVRESSEPRAAWERWKVVRHELTTTHPQSPIRDPNARAAFQGPYCFEYDPAFRVLARLHGTPPERLVIEGSADGRFAVNRCAVAEFDLRHTTQRLALYWMEGYGGGLFLPFRDGTSGKTTYGSGRYLLDTVKGADLGSRDGALVLDFNFAYQPSCAYDPFWACPLTPPENRLTIPVEAGERLTEE